ncbi:BatD family protein [Candidatus Protochlamydia phocaeensis]|uniref:BatD family protein n=1 Tax=Candidatus Protochlamydia phocaeensis TaxID=1414722 RepID=UPI00083916A5|nr:BatD family protein [Candidatus Protochlamydia phocaeensis]
MVKLRLILYWVIFLPIFLQAVPAIVEISIEDTSSIENRPIEGMITVTHDKQDKVDPASFQMEEKPLKTTFIQDVGMTAGSGNTIVSIYSFTLPPQAKGLYILPAVSVKVGNQVYQSYANTYEVHSPDKALAPQTPHFSTSASAPTSASVQQPKQIPRKPAIPVSRSSAHSPIVFRLQAWVQGPSTLYPGQRTTLMYRISFNRSIDLTESTLPFVHPKDFEKIGDVHISDLQQGALTIQEISQEIKASRPGIFHFGPSKIAGYAYLLNSFGQKVYDKQLLQAEAPVVELNVKPFPSNSPASFNGALGRMQADIKMLSSEKIKLGEKINLQLTLSGISNLEELHLPSLACQPGFSGFFQLSDLPPSGDIKGESKIFQIELLPISAFVKAIPSIELSSFDAAEQSYAVQHTPSLPLTLDVPSLPPPFTPQPEAATTPDWDKLWDPSAWPLSPLEIKGIALTSHNLHPNWLQTPWVLLMLPLTIFLLGWQWRWHQQRMQQPKIVKKVSEELLKQALKSKGLPPAQVISLLEKAYWWKLWEEGLAPLHQLSPENLPQQGLVGEARTFISYLQMLQYSPSPVFALRDVEQQAKDLFIRLTLSKSSS